MYILRHHYIVTTVSYYPLHITLAGEFMRIDSSFTTTAPRYFDLQTLYSAYSRVLQSVF